MTGFLPVSMTVCWTDVISKIIQKDQVLISINAAVIYTRTIRPIC